MGIGWGLEAIGTGTWAFFFYIIDYRWTGSFGHDGCATTIYDSLLGYL
jgi:hypothetical protein